MEYSRVIQFPDLPDEILLMILRKMTNIEILYSLFGVNKRLNQIVCDYSFTNRLTMLLNLMDYHFCSLSQPTLNRFCSQILPKIHDKIQWLDLESSSMERILLATNYPNLSIFGLYNIQEQLALDLFHDESRFTCTYKNQISSLVINLNTHGGRNNVTDINARIFVRIINTFIYLRCLIFSPSIFCGQKLSFDNVSPTFCSSTLLELDIFVKNFSDCLYLLDERFNQLRILNIQINSITSDNSMANNQKKISNLRSFTLSCNRITSEYDQLILPLLRRMSDLEKLDLSLKILGKQTFVDGNNLKKNILNYMPFLNEFIFNNYSFDYSFSLL